MYYFINYCPSSLSLLLLLFFGVGLSWTLKKVGSSLTIFDDNLFVFGVALNWTEIPADESLEVCFGESRKCKEEE
jgi:hypothetical protein